MVCCEIVCEWICGKLHRKEHITSVVPTDSVHTLILVEYSRRLVEYHVNLVAGGNDGVMRLEVVWGVALLIPSLTFLEQ